MAEPMAGGPGGARLASRAAPARDLAVTGTLPADLSGVLMRNSPAPGVPAPRGGAAAPGDGIIHAVWLGGGRAWYRSRGVPGAARGIIRHAGHYLALADGAPPQELSPDLEPLGRFDFGGALPLGIGPHPRVDPRSGELVTLRSSPVPPFLTWAAIGPDGSVTQPPTEVPGLARPHLIHDFAITEHYLLFILDPDIIDPAAPAGARWLPGRGARVALVPRSGPADVTLADLEPLRARHLANAYETGAAGPGADADAFEPDEPGAGLRVVADLPCWPAARPAPGRLCRITVDPAAGTATLDRIGPAGEFPRIDDRLAGRPHRYITAVTASGHPALSPGEHDQVIRYDLAESRSDTVDTGMLVGEVIFVPRGGPAAEEPDGYYLSFARSLATPGDARSWLLVWDAADFPHPPVARVALPATVPSGHHAAWFPLHR
jgi:carotenoid cleavage dioxygenase-like enzyme